MLPSMLRRNVSGSHRSNTGLGRAPSLPLGGNLMTGFSKRQVALLRVRDDNRCAWTGMESDRLIVQHRMGRGMGGSKRANRLSNGVMLDSLINGAIESDATLQAEAVRRGVKVSRYADPLLTPVLHAAHGWVLLDDDGGFTTVEEVAA